MQMRNKSLLLVGILLFVVLNNPVLASEIGYVDYDYLFTSHPEYTVKNQEFQQSVEELRVEFNIKYQMRSEEDDLDKLIGIYEGKIDELYDKLTKYLLENVDKAIAIVAENNQIEMVLAQPIVLYGGIDLTQQVLKELYGIYGTPIPSNLR